MNSDHTHPLRGAEGEVLVRSIRGATKHAEPLVPLLHKRRGGGPQNELVRLDDGTLVVAPWGNWRKADS